MRDNLIEPWKVPKIADPQLVITYIRNKNSLQVHGVNWKIGDEQAFIRITELLSGYLKSPRFRETILKSILRTK